MGPAEPGAGRTGRPTDRPDTAITSVIPDPPDALHKSESLLTPDAPNSLLTPDTPDTPDTVGPADPDGRRATGRRGAFRGRGSVLAVAALSAASVAALAGALPAAAAGPRYRFWTDWNGSGAGWSYAASGPAATHPADGAVEGWRYEVAVDGAARAPRAAPSFRQLCSTTPALPGRVRVGVVLDYGTTGDTRPGQSPPPARGACARVRAGSDGVAVLAAVASIRFRADGLICAFDSYPSTGCVDLVGAAAPSPPRPQPPSTTPAPSPRSTSTPTGRPPHSGRPAATSPATGRPSAAGGRGRPVTTTATHTDASAGTHLTAGTRDPASSAPADAGATPTTRPAGAPGGREASSRTPAPGRHPAPTVSARRASGPTAIPGRVASPTTTAGPGTATPATTPSPDAAAGAAGAAGPSAPALVLTGDRRPGGGGGGATSTAVGGGLVLLLGAAAATVAVRRRRRGTA